MKRRCTSLSLTVLKMTKPRRITSSCNWHQPFLNQLFITQWVKVQKFQILNFRKLNLKLAVCLKIIKNSKFNGQIPSDKLKLYQKSYYYLQNSAFWGWLSIQMYLIPEFRILRLSMESQPQNPEFRNNPENFHPCNPDLDIAQSCYGSRF